MKRTITVGIVVGLILVLAVPLGSVAAKDFNVIADTPKGPDVDVYVDGPDVTFKWHFRKAIIPSKFTLRTSRGDRTVDLLALSGGVPGPEVTEMEYTWTGFYTGDDPYGSAWWSVKVWQWKWWNDYDWWGTTSDRPFHRDFPDDWTGFNYRPERYDSKGRLVYYELKRDYNVSLPDFFNVAANLPDCCEGQAGFFRDWATNLPPGEWDFISLKAGGNLTIKQGYRWDGASLPCKKYDEEYCPDGDHNFRSSFVHDALYDLMRMDYLTPDTNHDMIVIQGVCVDFQIPPYFAGDHNRKLADMMHYMIAIEEGQPKSDAQSDYFWLRAWGACRTYDFLQLTGWKYHVGNLTADASDGNVTLNWMPADSAGKDPRFDAHFSPSGSFQYNILRNGIVLEDGTGPVELDPSVTSYVDDTVVDGTTYSYQIRAHPLNLNQDDWSNIAQVTVNNAAPEVDAGPDAAINEGGTYASSGSFTDPGADTWTATVDYGDGSGAQPLALTGKTFSLSHVYADNGAYTVTVEVTDELGGVGQDTALVAVSNVAPAASIDSVEQPNPFFILPVVHTLTFNGNFTDPGWLDTHTTLWEFGDGNSTGTTVEENNPPDATGNSTASHAYASPGDYPVTLTVTDDDGDHGNDTVFVHIASGEEVLEAINDYIQALPGTAFKGPAANRQGAIANDLAALAHMLDAGNYKGPIKKLQNDVRAKADGGIDGTPKNDWVVGPDAQQDICQMIDDLVAYLETLTP